MGVHHDGCEPVIWDARSHDLKSSVSKSVGLLFERDQQTTASGFIIPIRFKHGLYKEVFNKDSSTLDCQIPPPHHIRVPNHEEYSPVLTTTTPRQHYLPYPKNDIKYDNTEPRIESRAELQNQSFSRYTLHKPSPSVESSAQPQKQTISRNSLHETRSGVESSVQLQKQSFSRNSLHETNPLLQSNSLPQPRDKHSALLLPTSRKLDSSNRFSSGLENLRSLQAKLADLAYAQGTQDASETKKTNKEEQVDEGYEKVLSAKVQKEDPSCLKLKNQSWLNYHGLPSTKTETSNDPLKNGPANSPSWSGYTIREFNSPSPLPPSQPPVRRHKPSCPSSKTEIATRRMHKASCPNFQKEVVGPSLQGPCLGPPRSPPCEPVSNGHLSTNTTQTLQSRRHKPTCIFSQPDRSSHRIHRPNCIYAASNAHMSY